MIIAFGLLLTFVVLPFLAASLIVIAIHHSPY